MTPRIPPPAHRRERGPTVVDTNLRLVQKQFLPNPPAFGASLGVIPSEFRGNLLRHKTRVA